MLVGMILLSLLFLILKALFFKCGEKYYNLFKKFRGIKIYNIISKTMFFNMFIRFILEGYLEFSLDVLLNL